MEERLSAPYPARRMRVFDALRGFTITLVVLGHVLLYMDLGMYSTVLSSVLITFRMPLFFFVSGFFAFRPLAKWTREISADIVKRKVRAQIICTAVFYVLYQCCFGHNVMDWTRLGFGGYWFTVVLFQIFMIYLAISLLARLVSDEKVMTCIMVGLAIVTAVGSFIVEAPVPRIYVVLSWSNLLKYFQFFTLGILARRYEDIFVRMISGNMFRAICVVGFTICIALLYSPLHLNLSQWWLEFLQEWLARYLGMFCVLIYFLGHSDYFERTAGLPAVLNRVGQRTLDIYMLHYFFLPHLFGLREPLFGTGMFVIQLLVAGTIAITIVSVCMIISDLIRSSDFLSVWLFGTRPRKTGTT